MNTKLDLQFLAIETLIPEEYYQTSLENIKMEGLAELCTFS